MTTPHLFAALPSHLPLEPSATRGDPSSGVFARTSTALGSVGYQLIELLACGGMASVYLAAQCRTGSLPSASPAPRNAGAALDRLVAAKTPHPTLADLDDDGASTTLQLLREARMGARLQHPSAVRVLDLVLTGMRPILVMEYVEGASVRELLLGHGEPAAPVPAPIAVRIVRDVLHALDELHGLRDGGTPLHVVHRDVTPANILVGLDGRARLSDFGLARPASDLPTRAPIRIEGTLRYLAPEQARGTRVDGRVDVYAAALVLWELLAGRRMPCSDRPDEILREVARGAPAARVAADTATTLAQSLRCACVAALSPDPAARPPSAQAFARLLARAAGPAGGIAPREAVADMLVERVGHRIERQRQRVAEWLAGAGGQPVAA